MKKPDFLLILTLFTVFDIDNLAEGCDVEKTSSNVTFFINRIRTRGFAYIQTIEKFPKSLFPVHSRQGR